MDSSRDAECCQTIELLVIESGIASELTYEQLLNGVADGRTDRILMPPSIHSLDSDGVTMPWNVVIQ